MTREDAISIMNVIVHMLEEKYDTDRVEEAVDMAIKALEQEPCEDCISRAEAINAISHAELSFQVESDLNFENYKREVQEIADGILKGQVKAISDLPSIQPKPKTECSCEQIKWERDIAIEQLHELGYELGQKIEPCEDCISRQQALYQAMYVLELETSYDNEKVEEMLRDLPSIQPKTDVLDKIMKEIKEIYADIDDVCIKNGLNLARRIINKYKAESEDKE